MSNDDGVNKAKAAQDKSLAERISELRSLRHPSQKTKRISLKKKKSTK